MTNIYNILSQSKNFKIHYIFYFILGILAFAVIPLFALCLFTMSSILIGFLDEIDFSPGEFLFMDKYLLRDVLVDHSRTQGLLSGTLKDFSTQVLFMDDTTEPDVSTSREVDASSDGTVSSSSSDTKSSSECDNTQDDSHTDDLYYRLEELYDQAAAIFEEEESVRREWNNTPYKEITISKLQEYTDRTAELREEALRVERQIQSLQPEYTELTRLYDGPDTPNSDSSS